MQLVSKKIRGKPYWYLIRKGRKNGVPTNVETIYLGKPERIAELLGHALTPGSAADFPVGAQSREVGASAALVSEAGRLGLVGLIDEAISDKARRSDAAVTFGELLVTMAIQRAIAPRPLKSLDQLQRWYEGCGVRDFLPLQAAGLDARRVDEALSQLRSDDLRELESRIVERAVKVHKVSLEKLTFDATNFDSYAAAGTRSRLLRRGNAKSKRKNLRILGLGLLVSADGGIPLLSFPYPGNKPDVKSFKSFLRCVADRADRLPIDPESTIAFDGGNISQDVVARLDTASLHFVARLPSKHAAEAAAIPTRDLPVVKGDFSAQVRAKKLKTKVYGIERTVVAVFSDSMRTSQVPGIERDIRRAKKGLDHLAQRLERQRLGERSKPLTVSQARSKAVEALEREHLAELFRVSIEGNDSAPVLQYDFDQGAWKELYENRLGRTLILTTRDDWTVARIVVALRKQSHAEDAFRQMKDAEWAAIMPLRHYEDRMLRAHAFVSVLALILASLLVRRLRQGGMPAATVSNALYELSELRATKLRYPPTAPARLKALARRCEVAPDPTPSQQKILTILGLQRSLGVGTTRLRLKMAS